MSKKRKNFDETMEKLRAQLRAGVANTYPLTAKQEQAIAAAVRARQAALEEKKGEQKKAARKQTRKPSRGIEPEH